MKHNSISPDRRKQPSPIANLWLWLSMAGVLLAVVGNILALTIPNIYARLTPAFLPQAIAQDVSSLIFVSPLWILLAILAMRGSLRAYLLWLGVLIFTVYNYVIYTFSVPFGPLFLLWVVVFGISLFTLIGGIATVDHKIVVASFKSDRSIKFVAWFLIVVAILFALLWLSEDVPALLSGTTPQSVVDMAIPTNPVHILDLGFFLPAVTIIAIMLLRKEPFAYTLTPAFIVFLILTGIPILITPIVQSSRGEVAGWGVFIPIGTLTLLLLGLLAWLLTTIHSDAIKESK